jgi:hypothetical protein
MNVLMTGAVTVVVTLCADALCAQQASTTLTPQALAEIAQVEAEIDRIEARIGSWLRRRQPVSKSSCSAN